MENDTAKNAKATPSDAPAVQSEFPLPSAVEEVKEHAAFEGSDGLIALAKEMDLTLQGNRGYNLTISSARVHRVVKGFLDLARRLDEALKDAEENDLCAQDFAKQLRYAEAALKRSDALLLEAMLHGVNADLRERIQKELDSHA